VGFLYIPGYDRHDPKMVLSAIERLDSRYEPVIVKLKEEARLTGDEWRQFLPLGNLVTDFASARGLTTDTLSKFRVGQNGKFTAMPCFEDGLLRGIKMWNTDPGCSPDYRFFQVKGSRQGLLNFDRV
jgi:hypothetical protein